MANVTIAEFRANFPEFTSTVNYPDTQITFWLSIAYLRLRASRWKELLPLGVQLFVGHNLVIEQRAQRSAAFGGIPGESSGMLNSKSVDKASAGYDTASVAVKDGGNYNLTTYGLRFKELANIVGAGSVQVPSDSGVPYGAFGWVV